MSIKYNGQIIAGKYKSQLIPQADTINAGVVKIATDKEVEQATSNNTAVTPLHLSSKQDKLIAGENILIDENLIECEIYPDNTTIIKNDDKTFTVIGNKTKSNTIKIDWEGTNDEYEAGLLDGSIQPDWYCYITDDEQIVDYEDYVTNDTLEASNIFKLGENKLSDPKGYSQLKLEYDKGSSKIDVLVKDDYKIIGSPEISEDGILSNTSNTDYIYKNNIDFNGNDYEITLNFTLSNINSQNDYTLLFLNCGSAYDDTSAFFRSWVSSVGQLRITYTDGVNDLVSTEAYNLDLNKTYTIKIGYDYQNDQMYQKIFDNNGMMLTFQYINLEDYVENFMTGNSTLTVGYGINGGLENTVIDLNSLKVKSNNEVLYTPVLRIPYILSEQGSKIVDSKYQYRVLNWYEINGESKYYVIDTINKTFYMPLVSNVLSNVVYNLLDNDLSNITQSGLDIIKQNGGSSLPLGTPVVLDKILSYEESQGLALQGTYVYKSAIAGSRYGYPDFYEKYVNYKNNSTATQTTLGSSTITIYTNANGLQFYNIADKGVVDTFFNSTGVADFYGIDEANECIFLPRNNKFWQFTTNINEVNNYVEAGLPNITGATNQVVSGNASDWQTEWIGAIRTSFINSTGVGLTEKAWAERRLTSSISLDASRSNAIYGKSDTVQPPSSKKLLYYVVGNTVSDTSWIDAVTQVEDGVKDLEDKTQEGINKLNNITNTGRTNCIIEIPQDIKLELNNGVLTLKSGSKVYVPNGFEANGTTPKFDEIVIANDIVPHVPTSPLTDVEYVMVYDLGRNDFWANNQMYNCVSGTSAPTSGSRYFYNTGTNILTFYSAGVPEERLYSLPLGVIKCNSDRTVASFETFDGFGYIGQTDFVLPNVKGLCCDYRNEDGSYKSIEFTIPKVLTFTTQTDWTQNQNLYISADDEAIGYQIIGRATYDHYYDENQNIYIDNNGVRVRWCNFASQRLNNGIISNFTSKLPFCAIDYSDKTTVSSWTMPSNRYIDLTLGASGSTYTAPTNGYFSVSGTKPTAGQVLFARADLDFIQTSRYIQASGSFCIISPPAKKNDIYIVAYDGSITNGKLRFIYAEGEV